VRIYKYHEEKHRSSVQASREVGIEVHTEKTKYMAVSRHHNAGQNHILLIANKCGIVQVLETAVINQITFSKKLRANQMCGMLVAVLFSPLFSRLRSEGIKIKVYKPIILCIVLYGCETLSVTPRELTVIK
jgi:hypothetical protein